MIGDRQTATEDNDADDENSGRGIGDAVIERDRAADRFQGQEGNGAERGIGHAGRGPAPGALGGEAKRVILQRLVCNPLIILASDAVDPLPPCHSALPVSKRSSAIWTATPVPKSTSLFCGAIYAILRICALHNPRHPRSAKTTSSKTNGVLMSAEKKRGLKSPLRRKPLAARAAFPAIPLLPRPSWANTPATSAVNT